MRPYAWGSRTAIAELQGRPVPAPGPEAELWMGAHPSAPSGVDRTSRPTLDAVIAADPDGELGPECAATVRRAAAVPAQGAVGRARRCRSRCTPRVRRPQAGYGPRTERGLAPDDPARNYVDDWPKPELLYALTPFEVVAGLRAPADAAALLRALAVDQLSRWPAGFLPRPRASHGGRAGVGPGVARARRAGLVAARRRRLRAAGVCRFWASGSEASGSGLWFWASGSGPQAAATRTPAPRRCGSPRITRVTSGWSRCC